MTGSLEARNVWFSFPRARGRLPWFDRAHWAHGDDLTHWVLRDVSIAVQPGESLAVLGRNGAGKSTLLRVMAGVLPPMRGAIDVHGRVAPLLRVGGGLQPQLTARANIRLSAAVHGIGRREADRLTPAIVAFAELEDALDQRVEEFSSGMNARLSFAVLAHLEADLFLFDEVLSAGDAPFRRRCRELLAQRVEQGKSVVFVSHEPALVRDLCDRAVLMDKGRIVAAGEPAELLQRLETGPRNDGAVPA